MTTFNKLLDMKGMLCLITGASGSIGSVLSETMSELGADLIILDKDLGKLITEGTVYIECHMTVAKINKLIAQAENRKAFFKKYK